MSRLRIAVLANSRPSRVRRMIERLLSEVPAATVCAVVARPLESLTRHERLIADGRHLWPTSDFRDRSPVGRWIRAAADSTVNSLLWFMHGCPPRLQKPTKITLDSVAEFCRQTNCGFLAASAGNQQQVREFIRSAACNMLVSIGDEQPDQELLALVDRGAIRLCEKQIERNSQLLAQVSVEYVQNSTEVPVQIASVDIPAQIHDEPLAFALKVGLIGQELLVETVKNLACATASQTSIAISAWIEAMLVPYLSPAATETGSALEEKRKAQLCRSGWKLLLYTIVLCSPLFIRNCYRRLTRRYPIVILTHHLISDRSHRMAMPTAVFWRAVRFLARHYRIISLSQAMQLLSSGHVSTPTAVITFDDGYGENFINLRAVAEEIPIPVVLFVSTGPVTAHRAFEHDIVQCQTGALPLTWQQIRYWNSREGVEFGSHTRTHYDCGSSERTRLESEIRGSRSDLEARLGESVSYFAFPFGKPHNISDEALDLAASTYSSFLSCFGGENLPCRSLRQQHLLRRNFYEHPWELELELQSVLEFLDKVRKFAPRRTVETMASPSSPPLCPKFKCQQARMQ